jgi:hypothetical protein
MSETAYSFFRCSSKIGGKLMKYRMLFSICLIVFIGILAGCGGSSTKSASPTNTPTARKVTVTLTDSTLESSVTTFTAGLVYSFVVTNKGKNVHDFIIRTRPNGPVTNPQSGVLYDTKELQPGTTRSFSFAFPLSAPQSQVQFASEYAGPNANGAGIQIPVEVKQG